MFSQMSIKTRLIGAFGLFTFLLFFVGGLGIYSAQHNVALLKTLTIKDKTAEADVLRIKYRMEFNRSELLRAIQHDPSFSISTLHDHSVDKHVASIEASNKILQDKLGDYKAGIADPKEKELFDSWVADSNNMAVDTIHQVMAAVQAGQWETAETMTVKVINPLFIKSDADSKALAEYLMRRAEKNRAQVDTNIAQMSYLLIAVILLGVIMAVITGWWLIRGITIPLQHAVEVARRVADGDLRSDVSIINQDEIGKLLNALKDMNASLAHIVGEVRLGTETIASASGQIAAGNLDLSSRTEAQAGSLEETASAMEELTSTVKQNADNARQANQLAETASEVAVKGGTVVSEVVATMGAINDSARKIADIIGVIDGIAFQTNILALNAAVEAARAGEQGRGFAVVASEVRSLAQRSAAAAKEIKSLIDDSVEKIEVGNKQAGQAGTTMNEVVSSVQRVTDIMSEITAASHEQSMGIEEINRAISQMDETTQQNAALVEEAAAAAKSMQDQAGHLEELVYKFKLGDARSLSGKKRTSQADASRRRIASSIAVSPGKYQSKPVQSLAAATDRGDEWETF